MADALEYDSTVRYWLNQIETAQKLRQKWYERAKKINERYVAEQERAEADPHTMNVLWSNVETIKPALYAKTPNAKVSRRYRDKDPVGRWAAIVLERSLGYGLDCYDFDYEMRSCVSDFLLPGMGQIWVSYEPKFDASGKQIEWERVNNRQLHYKDFLHGPARTWKEVPWGSQRVYMTREEVDANPRFKGMGEELSFEETPEDKDRDPTVGDKAIKKAAIWEIWDKTSSKVYFVSKHCPELLCEPEPPFLKLENFFPFPRPLLATVTTDSLIPTPDFILYQNQADEIDLLTHRINLMCEALRVVGIYDSSWEAIGDLLGPRASGTNQMVPCANFAVLAANGGLDKAIGWFPLDQIVKALQQAYLSRDQAKQVMYEVTGISDIVRGASDPKETLGAQQIKTQWGGLRIRDRQSDVQRFARDIMRLNAEIMAENFQPQTLRTMSNVPLLDQAAKEQLQKRQQFAAEAQQMMQADPAQAQAIAQQNPQLAQMAQPLSLDEMQQLQEPAWEEVIALLKDQKLRSFRIGIETDSTINADETEEKAARVEFVTALTSMVQTWGPIVMQAPQLAPLFGEVLLFATRAFRTAEGLETAIEEAVEMMSQQALLPKPPMQEDPKVAADKEKVTKEDDFKRYELDHNRETQRLQGEQQAQAEAQKARAAGPQPQDVQAALGPFVEVMQSIIVQGQQAQAQGTQQQIAQMQASLEQAIQMLAKIASAPKSIQLMRGPDGKVAAGVATPMHQGAMN